MNEEDIKRRIPGSVDNDLPDGPDLVTVKDQEREPKLITFEEITLEKLAELSGGIFEQKISTVFYTGGWIGPVWGKDKELFLNFQFPPFLKQELAVEINTQTIPLKGAILVKRPNYEVDVVFAKEPGEKIRYATLSEEGISLHVKKPQYVDRYLKQAFDLVSIRPIDSL